MSQRRQRRTEPWPQAAACTKKMRRSAAYGFWVMWANRQTDRDTHHNTSRNCTRNKRVAQLFASLTQNDEKNEIDKEQQQGCCRRNDKHPKIAVFDNVRQQWDCSCNLYGHSSFSTYIIVANAWLNVWNTCISLRRNTRCILTYLYFRFVRNNDPCMSPRKHVVQDQIPSDSNHPHQPDDLWTELSSASVRLSVCLSVRPCATPQRRRRRIWRWYHIPDRYSGNIANSTAIFDVWHSNRSSLLSSISFCLCLMLVKLARNWEILKLFENSTRGRTLKRKLARACFLEVKF